MYNTTVCPNCGHCPTCGRKNWYPQSIGYQTPPMWCGTTVTQQESILNQYQSACENQMSPMQAAQNLAQAQCNAGQNFGGANAASKKETK